MRTTKVLSITLPAPMLKEARELAKQENRTMSELVRRRCDGIRERILGRSEHAGASECRGGRVHNEDDVVRVIHEYRQEQRAKRRSGAAANLVG